MDRINRKQTELILGGVTIPCVTMVNEVIGLTVQGIREGSVSANNFLNPRLVLALEDL